jgi:hypothetical protein
MGPKRHARFNCGLIGHQKSGFAICRMLLQPGVTGDASVNDQRTGAREQLIPIPAFQSCVQTVAICTRSRYSQQFDLLARTLRVKESAARTDGDFLVVCLDLKILFA